MALFHMKSAEANLEGTIQLFVIICLHFIPFLLPKVSGLGRDFEPSQRSTGVYVLLFVSPIVTLISNIIATVSAMDINKGGQLSLKGKCIFGMYLLFQLASHLFRMVTRGGKRMSPWRSHFLLLLLAVFFSLSSSSPFLLLLLVFSFSSSPPCLRFVFFSLSSSSSHLLLLVFFFFLSSSSSLLLIPLFFFFFSSPFASKLLLLLVLLLPLFIFSFLFLTSSC